MDTLGEQLERVKRSLDSLPAALSEARRAVADRRKDVELAKANRDDLEGETLILVGGETNDKDKPLFANKEAREAEVRRRLKANPTYRERQAALEAAETAKLNADLHFSQLQDEDRALDRTLDALGHQLRWESIQQLTRSVVELTTLEAKRLAGMEGR